MSFLFPTAAGSSLSSVELQAEVLMGLSFTELAVCNEMQRISDFSRVGASKTLQSKGNLNRPSFTQYFKLVLLSDNRNRKLVNENKL